MPDGTLTLRDPKTGQSKRIRYSGAPPTGEELGQIADEVFAPVNVSTKLSNGQTMTMSGGPDGPSYTGPDNRADTFFRQVEGATLASINDADYEPGQGDVREAERREPPKTRPTLFEYFNLDPSKAFSPTALELGRGMAPIQEDARAMLRGGLIDMPQEAAGLAYDTIKGTITGEGAGQLGNNVGRLGKLTEGLVPLKNELQAGIDGTPNYPEGGLMAAGDQLREDFRTAPISTVLNVAGAAGMIHSPVARGANSAMRSIMASGDISAPGRQGLVLSVARPRQALHAGEAMIRAGRSEAGAQAVAAEIASRPTAALHQRFALAVGEGNEMFPDSYAKEIPGVGHTIKASDRAYTSYLIRLRADVFDSTAAGFQKKGITPESNPKAYQDLADWVNVASGHGGLGVFEPGTSRKVGAGSVQSSPGVYRVTPAAQTAQKAKAAGALSSLTPALREVIFAPRFQSSRVALLSPLTYLKLSPEVRAIALRDMAATVAGGVAVLQLAKVSGAEVGDDPASPDWGKIVLQDGTRYDVWGGMRPWARLVALAEKAHRTGDTKPLGKAVARRGESVLSPLSGLVLQALRGSDYNGEKFELGSGLAARFTPLFLQDLAGAVKDSGPILGPLQASPAALGVGMQKYTKEGNR